MSELEAVVISDLHLGSSLCKVDAIVGFLETLPPTRRLILNGDVLESSDHRLNRRHWKVLSLLRKLSDTIEVIWVRGNHDHDAEAVAHLVGARYVDEFILFAGGRSFLCIHGDSYDRFIVDHPVLTFVADWFYHLIHCVSPNTAIYAKHSSKAFLRCCDDVKKKAKLRSSKDKIDVVLCGHTHRREADEFYVNTGSWTEPCFGFATIDEYGITTLKSHKHVEKTD